MGAEVQSAEGSFLLESYRTLCAVPSVPADSTVTSDGPNSEICRAKSNSAEGERQRLPVQTKSTMVMPPTLAYRVFRGRDQTNAGSTLHRFDVVAKQLLVSARIGRPMTGSGHVLAGGRWAAERNVA